MEFSKTIFRAILYEDRIYETTFHEILDEVGIYKTMFHEILDEDGIYKTKFPEIHTENCDIHRVAANFVPCLLGEEHKIVCISVKCLSTVHMLITF
jgi:hypothetical protein